MAKESGSLHRNSDYGTLFASQEIMRNNDTYYVNPDKEKDVFVHHSALNTKEEQYKYAVEGEYVEFVMTAADSDNHKWQASSVTGLGGGPLLCETRNARRARFNDEDEEDQAPRRRGPPRAGGRPRFNAGGGGPRWVDEEDDNFEWTLVRRRRARGSSHRPPVARHQGHDDEDQELEY